MSQRLMNLVLGHLRKLAAMQTASDRPDHQLLRRFVQEGDEAAFEALLRRHGPMVLGVCRRVLERPQDVEDAFQATFIVLARKAATIRKPQAVGSWLHGVAFRMARQIKAANRPSAALGEGPEVRDDPLEELTWREVRVALDEELQSLPQKYRAPLLLCYLEGYTQDEAARQLGWSKSTVRRRLEKGRELLKGRLTRRGLTLSVALFGVVLTPTRASSALPPALSRTTLHVILAATGRGAGGLGAVSPRVLAQADALTRVLLLARLKTTIGVVLTLGLVAVGAVLGTRPLWVAQFTPANAAAIPPAGVAPAAGLARQGGPPIRTDLLGDPLPDAVRTRLGTPRLSAGGVAYSCLFAPDGQTLIAGAEGVFLWQLATGKTIRCLEGHHRRVFPVAISPDGRTLLSAELDGTILRWDARTGEKRGQFLGEPHDVFHLVISPDGRTLASGGIDGVVRIWDLAGGQERHRLETRSGASPEAILWPIAFLPDNRTLVLQQSDRRIAFWDSMAGVPPRLLDWLPRDLSALALARDGKALALARAEVATVVVCDPATGKQLGEWHGHQGTVESLAFSPDGRALASAGTDRTIRIWELATSREVGRIQTEPNHTRFLEFSPDGRLLAGGCDTSIRLWDVATGQERFAYQGHRGEVRFLAFAPDGQTLVSQGGDDTIRQWEIQTGRHLGHWQGLAGRDVLAAALSPDGTVMASGARDGTLLLQDRRTGKELCGWDGSSSSIRALAFGPDGRTLAAGSSDGTLVLWDVATGRESRRFDEHPSVRSLAFSPDGNLLAAGYRDGSLRLWETATGKAFLPFAGVRTSLEALTFSPDGKMLAGVADRSGFEQNPEALTLWEVATGQVRWQWAAQGHRRWCVVFSPDGKLLASGGADRLVRLWDLTTGDELPALSGHHGPVGCVAFSPDGQTLASGSMDTTILLWDTARWRPRKTRQTESLKPAQLEALWADLARPDARQAYRAVRTLTAAPDQAAGLFQKRLRPGSVPEPLGREIRIGLKEAADIGPALRERRRTIRAIEVLEALATPAARRLLRGLADEADGASAAEARAALARLAGRRIAPP